MSRINVTFIRQKFSILKLHFKKLGIFNLIIYIFRRIINPPNSLIKVSVPGILHPVYLRNNSSDTQIFTQIFLREELNIDLTDNPKTIIDGGANIGLASIFLKNKYPDVYIFSIEPDLSNFEMLLKNTICYKNIICYNNGIWNQNTKLKIINKDAGNESFVVKELKITDSDMDVIRAITIDQIVNDNSIKKIDLLKLDIEGSEGKVFEDNYDDWLSITENMLIEIHNWIDSRAEITVMTALASNYTCKMAGEYHFFKKI